MRGSGVLSPSRALSVAALLVAGVFFFARTEVVFAARRATPHAAQPMETPSVATVGAVGTGASRPHSAASVAPLTAAPSAAAALDGFGGALLSAQAEQGGGATSGGGVFLSPLSVASCLGLVASGATGAVRAAFTAALRADFGADAGAASLAALGAPSPGVQLTVANSLWARGPGGVRPAFAAALAASPHNASAHELTTAAAVNAWVAAATGGKIGHLVDDSVVNNPLTKALLVNAVLFKGAWLTPFDPALTTDAVFRGSTSAASGGARCRMMRRPASHFRFAAAAGARAVELPYLGGGHVALLVLPDEEEGGSKGGSKGVEALAASAEASLPALRAALRHARVEVLLPRFRLAWGPASLKGALVKLGLGPAFAAGGAAAAGAAAAAADEPDPDGGAGGFGLMSDDPTLHLSDVIHTAVVEVDERGTTAAAATAAVMMMRAAFNEPPPERIVFDRPFLMSVETVAGAPLFLGVVADLSELA